MVINGHNHSDLSENMQRCCDYIKALEEERAKIQVFQRELPLCLELVTQAIETCRQQQLSETTTDHNLHGQSDCSEHTSSHVFKEFIPMKMGVSPDSDGEEEDSKKSKINEKSDWLRSVQLWNQTPDPPSKEDLDVKFSGSEMMRDGDAAFHPFKKERGSAAPASTSSTVENGGGGDKKEAQRKARRCWSPELHRRFLQALQQLGGSHVATPKQIRELMKVDGLTNDEVKSHLQKYRLHTRRPNSSAHSNNAQTPQFVVVGGLWMPSEYTSTSSVKAPGGATFASPPPPFQEPLPSPNKRQQVKASSQSNDDCSYSKGGGAQSCSAATSSSGHTTTAVSPAC
ncbi:hypothetical protein SASPL_110358 [Salvia splendens]|uniref:HTH myb-type domain-containing protein n=1 Tax=Salvia splendens TaxID=180675 RepID=A0A8X8Y8Q2_SALSN|nr:transcription factor HHO3-like [Salvia splendens]KAG6426142.1 hypothetical protein SASPL_110358 [Salvia splendens]